MSYISGKSKYTEIMTINMCLLIEIRHNILTQGHGKYIEGEKLHLYAWNWHFKKKWLTATFGCPEGWFLRVWVSKWHPGALLAKIMVESMQSYQVGRLDLLLKEVTEESGSLDVEFVGLSDYNDYQVGKIWNNKHTHWK